MDDEAARNTVQRSQNRDVLPKTKAVFEIRTLENLAGMTSNQILPITKGIVMHSRRLSENVEIVCVCQAAPMRNAVAPHFERWQKLKHLSVRPKRKFCSKTTSAMHTAACNSLKCHQKSDKS
ncbi:DNA repair protein-CtIP [Pyrenophora tritici-repentis]|nr:DNA repair protein-CtIP [Pyrenophora tritici-repentis]